jgi:hypothetical protein
MSKVTIEIERDKIDKVFELIREAQHPKVVFCEDIEIMRADAAKATKDAVFNIGVTLSPYMTEKF